MKAFPKSTRREEKNEQLNRKRKAPDELNDLKWRGICYDCGEKWHPRDHICKVKDKSKQPISAPIVDIPIDVEELIDESSFFMTLTWSELEAQRIKIVLRINRKLCKGLYVDTLSDYSLVNEAFAKKLDPNWSRMIKGVSKLPRLWMQTVKK